MFKELIKIWKKKDLSSQTLDESLEALRLDYKMYRAAVESLRTSDDGGVKIDIYKTDKQINESERAIRKKVLEHLLILDKADVVAGLTLASIVIDIERIGDYTKNIADLALLHKKRLHGGKHEEVLTRIEKRINEFFQLTIDAFPTTDANKARSVIQNYQEVSRDCTVTTQALIRGDGKFSVSDAVSLGLYLRYLKRIGAHLHNICTSIVNPFHQIGYDEKQTN